MSRRIRVLEMIDEASLGGGQMHVLLLAKHLDKSEFDVTIATEQNGFLVEEAMKIGIQTVAVSMSNDFSLRTVLRAKRLFEGNNYDILHTHGGTAGFWGRAAALLHRSPRIRIHTYHGLHYLGDGSNVRRFQFADRLMLLFTTKIVCVCKSDASKAVAAKVTTEKKTVVINNGIEVGRFGFREKRESIRSALGVGDGDFVYGNVGRLHKQKGQETLLRAFKEVALRRPKVHLWLVGEGEILGELQSLAKQLEITSQVRFLGARTNVAELLSAIDAFVLPSLWEGQPIALLEAMASETPVIASNVDGIPEIVENRESGLLVTVRNVDSLAAAMNELVAKPGLCKSLARRGRERIVDEFTAQRMALGMADLYKGAVS